MDDLINKMADEMASDLLRELEIDIPEYLKRIFEIEKKSDLEKYCKTITITQKDFVILVYNSYKLGYKHQIKYKNYVPDNLKPTDEEVNSLSSIKQGEKLAGSAKRFISKIFATFDQRRYLVVHIFYNTDKWHCFYFDQRDIQNSHWEKGCHLHFINYLWPNYNPNDVWTAFDKSNASFGDKLHIKFKPIEREDVTK